MSEKIVAQNEPEGQETVTISCDLLTAIGAARGLGTDECHYLFILLAHMRPGCPHATFDAYSHNPPTLLDWTRWLNVSTHQQVCNIRNSLRKKGVILFLDDDPKLVTINSNWREWELDAFIGQEKRRGAGRRATGQPSSAAQRLLGYEWRTLRQQVLKRDNFTCVYCGRSDRPLRCDHIIPVVRGGTSDMDNLATACDVCNNAKRDKTPEEWAAWLQQRKQQQQ